MTGGDVLHRGMHAPTLNLPLTNSSTFITTTPTKSSTQATLRIGPKVRGRSATLGGPTRCGRWVLVRGS